MPARKTAPKTSTAAKATKAPAKHVPTLDKPLPSGWVRQSTVPLSDELAVSKFTTQTQRKLVRAIAEGTDDRPRNIGELSPQTMRSIERLKGLGLVSIAKDGTIKPTGLAVEFVQRTPAPVIRVAKPKAEAKKAPAKAAKQKVTGKTAAKPRRAVRRSSAKVAA